MRAGPARRFLTVCATALLISGCAAGVANRGQNPDAVISLATAKALPSGVAQFLDGSTMIAGPTSADWIHNRFRKMIEADPLPTLEDVQRRYKEFVTREQWDLPLIATRRLPAEDLATLCDDYLRYVLLLRLPAFPDTLKRVELNAALEDDTALGSCRYRRSDQRFFSERTGKPVITTTHVRRFGLSDFGTILAAPVMTIRRFDLERPLVEFLLVLPHDKTDPASINHAVDIMARRLQSEFGKGWNISFSLAETRPDRKGFFPIGVRRITVRTPSGDYQQIANLSFSLGVPDPDTGKVSPDHYFVNVEVVNPELDRHMADGTLDDYLKEDFYRDSQRYLDNFAAHAANRAEIDKILITSVSVDANGEKAGFTAAYARINGKWTLQRPLPAPEDRDALPRA